MTTTPSQIKHDLMNGLAGISQFWGFPRGMGACFSVLYTSPSPLSLDDLVAQTGLTKGAISTNVRALARLGLILPVSRPADRKDYYIAETDFYKAIRSILMERKSHEFDRAVSSVRTALASLDSASLPQEDPEVLFLRQRLLALQSFFDALDSLTNAVARLDGLGFNTVQTVLKILK